MTREFVLKPAPASGAMRIDYEKELNPQQWAAVTADNGPALVIAGAGSGKTRTLTFRLAWLVEHGVAPENVLLLTFTNKAAQEMLKRAQELIGGDIHPMWSGTFHHLAHRGLRRHAKLVGFEHDFTILDREDSKDLLNSCIAAAGIDVKAERFPRGDVLVEMLGLIANTEQPLSRVLHDDYPYFEHLQGQIANLAALYARRKQQTNVMDFDDLLTFWRKLLQQQPDLRKAYGRRFQYILVDEYQDTNKIQADIVDLLAEEHKNVMVVGDDAQSIYSWRGANFRNILTFPERYPNCKVFKIETNYRSVPEILSAANSVIALNRRQFKKTLRPSRPSGPKPVLVPCADANQQAVFVASQILQLREEGTPLQEISVLYRNHYHSMELQMELTRRNIPFQITSGLRFFEQAHIKDVAAFLKLAVNPSDELAFKRMTQLVPGVGGKTAQKLWEWFREEVSGRRASAGGNKGTHPVARLSSDAACKLVPRKATAEWGRLAATLEKLAALCPREDPAPSPNPSSPIPNPVSTMLRLVVDEFYDDYMKVKFSEYRSRREDLDQLELYATQYRSAAEFLAQLALMTNLEAEDARPDANRQSECVRLSTVHQAKGQEWSAVFVIWLADGMFPSARSLAAPFEGEEDRDGEEEERRLFYVALTRAKDELYLCYPILRKVGSYEDALQKPSRFIQEIPNDLRVEATIRTERLADWRHYAD